MRSTLLKAMAIATMLVGGLTAAQALQTAGAHRPAAVPANYLITPFGYFHPSCVVQLAKGDELLTNKGVIQHSNGTSSKMPLCSFAHYRADGERVMGDEQGIKNPDISHAWIEYASVVAAHGKSYGYLYAEWPVPPTPTANDGQTLYYFPGVEDIDDVVTIIQPVLGWNSDYASAWGIASWNCCESGTTYEATPQPVSSGDNILGYMFDTCAGKGCTSWDIVTWDLQNNKFSQLTDTSNFGQTFNWAFGGVLEVYNISECTDYPSNGGYPGTNAISFNEIGLFSAENDRIGAPQWSISNISGGLTPQCGYGGSLPKQVILTY
jgi:hypothetical protein